MQPPHPEILFIVNPNAGRRDQRRLLKKLARFRSQIDVRFSEYAGHCREITRSGLDKYRVFVAAGGDGTVNEVASALVGKENLLAVYPSGSGNGFARELGFDRNIKNLLRAVERGKTRHTDVLDLNGRISVNMAGIGFDSAVAHHFARLKSRGFLNYAISAMRLIRKYKPVQATIIHKDKTIEGKFFMISIANTRQFGNNALIAPEADPQDGRMNIVLAAPFPLWLFPLFAIRLFRGTLGPSKYMQVVSWKKNVRIITSENKFHLDGEPEILDSPVEINVIKGKLNVVDTTP